VTREHITRQRILSVIQAELEDLNFPEPRVTSHESDEFVALSWSPNNSWWPYGEARLTVRNQEVQWSYVAPRLPICFQKRYDSQTYPEVLTDFVIPPVVLRYILRMHELPHETLE